MADMTPALPWPAAHHRHHDEHHDEHRDGLPLVVDCDRCQARGPSCDDCVVGVLLGSPAEHPRLSADELSALGALADAGLVPPLRLVRPLDSPAGPPG